MSGDTPMAEPPYTYEGTTLPVASTFARLFFADNEAGSPGASVGGIRSLLVFYSDPFANSRVNSEVDVVVSNSYFDAGVLESLLHFVCRFAVRYDLSFA